MPRTSSRGNESLNMVDADVEGMTANRIVGDCVWSTDMCCTRLSRSGRAQIRMIDVAFILLFLSCRRVIVGVLGQLDESLGSFPVQCTVC